MGWPLRLIAVCGDRWSSSTTSLTRPAVRDIGRRLFMGLSLLDGTCRADPYSGGAAGRWLWGGVNAMRTDHESDV